MGALLAHTLSSFTFEAWRPFSTIKLLSRGSVNIVQGTATRIDMDNRTAIYTSHFSGTAGQELKYDYLVVAARMKRVFPIVPRASDKSDERDQWCEFRGCGDCDQRC
jgi:NADH dehydrogenase FAD-containing subunit